MALRFMLVSLVASMGFEMPTGADLSHWTRSGRDWADARMADLSGLRAEAGRVFADPAESARVDELSAAVASCPGTTADLAFEAVGEGMATSFAADLALARVEESKPAAEAPNLARADEPAAVAPASAEPVVNLAATAEADCLDASEAGDPAVANSAEPSRADRISSAVRLTGEAVQAWANLIQSSADEPEPAR